MTFESVGKGPRDKAAVLHHDGAAVKRLLELGFHDGGGRAFDQRVAHTKSL